MTTGLNDKERHLTQLLFEAGIKIGNLEKQVQQLESEVKQLSDENTLLRQKNFYVKKTTTGKLPYDVPWWCGYGKPEPYLGVQTSYGAYCAAVDPKNKG